MSKEIEIYLSGYGYEIAQGEFSDEELTKLYQYCEDNDKVLDNILFEDLSEILEDRYEWYECDDIEHCYGLDEDNYTILKNIELFQNLNLPIMVGVSRKSMIYKKLGVNIENSLNGTSILNTVALTKKVQILRVHDVKEAKECIDLFQELK